MTKPSGAMRAARATLAALSAACVLAACGGGSSTAPVVMQGPVAPAGTTTVGTAGGTVATSDTKLKLTVAANALKGDTFFKITPLATITGLPADTVLLSGTAYQIDWTGAGFTGESDVSLAFATPQTAQVQRVRLTARGPRPLGNGPGLGGVVQCADGDHVYATSTDPNASDYSDVSAVLCTPTTDSGGGNQSSSQVGLTQPVPGAPPTITFEPVDVSDQVGDTATFNVGASGADPLSYQWRRDGVDIAGATTSSYSFVVALSDSGATFSAVVTNSIGSATSTPATLTVGASTPPAAPQWNVATALTPFGAGIDLPQVGVMVDTGIVAWNNNGVLDSNDATLHGRALPIRSRPKVLTGPNLSIGYIVYVDDDGTSTCQVGFGNRLSAIAEGFSFEAGAFPPSDRFTLYQSAGDCIGGFSAGMTADTVNSLTAVAFAVQELNASAPQAGIGGAFRPGTVVHGVTQPNWTPTTPVVAPLVASTDCASAQLSADGMMGNFQAANPAGPSPTGATLAFVGGFGNAAKVCAATFSGSTWSAAAMIFDNAGEAEPVVAIDAGGDSIVMASRIVDPSAPVLSYAMTSAYLPSAGTAWQVQTLDTSDAAALPSVAFDTAGNAYAVWRPNSPSGKSVVYTSHRSIAGAWDTALALSAANAVETRYPRICVDGSHGAIALFEQNVVAGGPFTVYSRLEKQGQWSDFAPVQNDGNDGRFADCPRNVNLSNLEIVWREIDPINSAQFRVMSSVLGQVQ